MIFCVPYALLPVWETAPFFGKFFAGLVGIFLYKRSQRLSELLGFFTIIPYAHQKQRIGEAHNAQADLTIATGDLLNLRYWKMVGGDHVVEESDSKVYCVGE